MHPDHSFCIELYSLACVVPVSIVRAVPRDVAAVAAVRLQFARFEPFALRSVPFGRAPPLTCAYWLAAIQSGRLCVRGELKIHGIVADIHTSICCIGTCVRLL